MWLFAIGGAVARATRLSGALTVVLTLAGAVVLIVTQTSLANSLIASRIRSDPLPEGGVDAVVVLSGGLNPNNTISGEALDHLITGLEIVREQKTRVLVTTTVEEAFPRGAMSSITDQSRIIALFGGDVRWIRTNPGKSTRDEAMNSARLLIPQGIRRVAVVSAPIHSRRACASFEAVDFVVICTPARARSPGGEDPAPWPADRMNAFGQWVYEAAATLKYRRNGWLRRAP